VLLEKYGENARGFTPVEGGARWPRFASGWWKDLMSLEGGMAANWFTARVVYKVVNRRSTSFWKYRWIAEQSLATSFPRIFSISSQKEAKVRDLWTCQNGEVHWNLGWRRQPFLWERNLIHNLLALLEGATLREEDDKWLWLPEEGGAFLVRSSYRVLEEILLLEGGLNPLEEGVFTKLWKSPAPSKVIAFSWMLLLDHIPTRSNLAFRRVLAAGEDHSCVLCGLGEESTTHLFLQCDVVSLIWRKVMSWLGFNFITPQNMLVHFECWSGEANSKQLRNGFWLI